MLIRNKRDLLARQLGGLGVLGLIERLARRPCLLVPTYHRMGSPNSSPFYDPVYSATPEAFEAQVRYLQRRFRLVSLAELLELADRGFPLAGPTALITFDDGYRDNFEQALPVLRSLHVPAAFFLPTGFLDRPRLTWWDRIAYVLKQTSVTRLVVDRPQRLEIDLNETPRPAAIWAVISLYRNEPQVQEAPFFEHLEERAEVAVASEALARGLFMSWDEVRELVKSGMAVGSHTHDHPNLARLSLADQARELAESRRILTEQLGAQVEALAYPYGDPGTFTPDTQRLAREAGYRAAFTAFRGVNRPGHIEAMAISRYGIGSSDTLALFRARAVCYTALGASPF